MSRLYGAGVTAVRTPRGFGPRSKSVSGYGPLFADLDPSYPTFVLSIVCILILFFKRFVDVLFHHNTTFLNKGKEKQLFRSNSAAFIIASRTVYARIRCEQTTAFELFKLLQ